jgi:hypothetical protein
MARPIPDLNTMTKSEVANDDVLIIDDTSAGETKKIAISELLGLPSVGWTATGETWTFSSFNTTSRIGVINVPSNATLKYMAGNWVRFVQSTGGTKWGRILSVTSTTITVWFTSAYTFNNEALTTPVYSQLATPVGLPEILSEGNPYSFSVYRNAALATSAGGAFYPAYDTEEYDNSDNYNTSNGRFTAPVKGEYIFNYGSIMASPGMGPTYTGIDKNGVEHKRCTEVPSMASGNNTVSGSSIVKMNAGDYVNVRLSTGSATNLVVGNTAYNWFNGALNNKA